MLSIILVVTIMIVSCFAGRITKIGSEDPGGNWCWDGESQKRAIMTTPKGNQFSLRFEYWINNVRGSAGLFHGNEIKSTTYKSVLKVYYEGYLLDTVKVPGVEDTQMYDIYSLDKRVVSSFKPVVPNPDIESPNSVEVYYSFTNGDCLLGAYSLTTSQGPRYLKRWDYGQSVNKRYCA